MDDKKQKDLNALCRQLRVDLIHMLHRSQTGHPGSSLSVMEILAALYFDKLSGVDPKRPDAPDRDRLLLSKGHAAPALYLILARLGYFPKQDLNGLRQLGSRLQGHPNMDTTPGIDYSSAPLGQGLSVGLGMALAAKLDNIGYTTYVVLGDGEIQEGMIWEAAMAAAKFKADNLIAILDRNGLQLDGATEHIMPLGDVREKWRSFGWHTICIDGHDIKAISDAVDEAKAVKGKPAIIIAQTVKGKGVSFMEGECVWHGRPIDEEHCKQALKELEGARHE